MPTYRVTGPFPYEGHEPDSTFEAEPSERIERAVKRGSISPTAASSSAPTSQPAAPATPQSSPPASPSPTDKAPKPPASQMGQAGDNKKE